MRHELLGPFERFKAAGLGPTAHEVRVLVAPVRDVCSQLIVKDKRVEVDLDAVVPGSPGQRT